jgi:hypothetical protein
MSASFSISFAAAAPESRSRPAHAAVARVQRLDALSASSAAPTVLSAAQEVVVPGSGEAHVSVAPGHYAVQVILPTGRILQEHCEVSEGEMRPLTFHDDRSDDRFSLQALGGADLPTDILDQLVGSRPPPAAAPPAAAEPRPRRPDRAAKAFLPHGAPKRAAAKKAPGGPRGTVRRSKSASAGASAGTAGRGKAGSARQREQVAVTRNIVRAPPAAPALTEPKLTIGISGPLRAEHMDAAHVWSTLGMADPPIHGGGQWDSIPPEAAREGAAVWHLPGDIVPFEERRWGVVETASCREIFSLPLPWWAGTTGGPTTLEIAVDSGTRGRAMTSLGVRDPLLEGLLAYLDRGQLANARPIVEALDASGTITKLIQDKMQNPLAACAAAYLGLAIFDPGEQERWDSWLPNVMNWFPWLPDGAIVHARRIVLRPSHSDENLEALDALKRAFRAGIPYYSVGVQLMREMLSLFLHDPEASDMLERVQGVASRVDLGQMFTVLRYPRPVA